MKNLALLYNAIQRSVLYSMLLVSALTIGLISCNDDEDEMPSGGSIDFGVPPSVIDGVRPSEASGIKINYYDDGTIRNAVVDDCTFTFNYATTRTTFHQLNSITAERSVDGAKESWKADNFILSNNGFIGGYRLTYSMNDSHNQWWENGEINYRFNYRDGERIDKIDLKTTFSNNEDGTFSGSGSYSYAYGRNGELLKITGTIPGYTVFEQKFDYDKNLANKYNTMLLTLTPEAVISDDAIFRILAVTGHLGNTSKKLPTKLHLSYMDPEDPGENSNEILTLDYNLGGNGLIYWYSVNDKIYHCKFVDASNVEIN